MHGSCKNLDLFSVLFRIEDSRVWAFAGIRRSTPLTALSLSKGNPKWATNRSELFKNHATVQGQEILSPTGMFCCVNTSRFVRYVPIVFAGIGISRPMAFAGGGVPTGSGVARRP